jgi:hypothetical protein
MQLEIRPLNGFCGVDRFVTNGSLAAYQFRKPSAASVYKLIDQMQTLLRSSAPQASRKPSAALAYKLDAQVQTLLLSTAPQTPRKPSAARGR